MTNRVTIPTIAGGIILGYFGASLINAFGYIAINFERDTPEYTHDERTDICLLTKKEVSTFDSSNQSFIIDCTSEVKKIAKESGSYIPKIKR